MNWNILKGYTVIILADRAAEEGETSREASFLKDRCEVSILSSNFQREHPPELNYSFKMNFSLSFFTLQKMVWGCVPVFIHGQVQDHNHDSLNVTSGSATLLITLTTTFWRRRTMSLSSAGNNFPTPIKKKKKAKQDFYRGKPRC